MVRATVAAAGFLAAVSAGASNGIRPRTAPQFRRPECLTVVDRSVDPSFVVEFGIPLEDDELTADELPDSRTFQFFALCEDPHPAVTSLPNWISVSDAQRAFDAGLTESLPEATDVIESHPKWSTCALPINGAAERVAISCEATEGGVGWDTTGVPAGNYAIRGYTFEPALNLWTTRAGVVQVTDGFVAPVVSLMVPGVLDSPQYEQAGVTVAGCMGGPAGTTVILSWARLFDLGTDEPSDWTPFAELDAGEGRFSVEFQPPSEAVNQLIVFRGEAVAPNAERWVGHAPGTALIYPGDGEGDEAEWPTGLDHCGFFPPDEPGGTTAGTGDPGSTTDPRGETSAAESTGSGSSTASEAEPPATERGCGCRVFRTVGDRERSRAPLAWLMVGLFAAAAARRRR